VRLYAERDDGGLRARIVAEQWIRYRSYRAKVASGEYPPPKLRGPAGARVIACGIVAAILLATTLVAYGCSALTEASVSASSPHGRIVSVADGDTVTVALTSGATRSVRLLAMDSPESTRLATAPPMSAGPRKSQR